MSKCDIPWDPELPDDFLDDVADRDSFALEIRDALSQIQDAQGALAQQIKMLQATIEAKARLFVQLLGRRDQS